MSSPHWQDAPNWAEWLAQDEDGEWNWFECEPSLVEGSWLYLGTGRKKWARATPAYEDPNLTLQQRPTATSNSN